jgi:hypothetical protein
MRRKIIGGLVLLNAFLAGAIIAVPAAPQVLPRGVWDCCKTDKVGEPYCCRGCCWFIWNCAGQADCQSQVE